MFGNNDRRPRENGNMLQVHELFFTIQGEGPFAGWPAVFLRLTGCNLACHFCDTTWLDASDPYYEAADLAAKIHSTAPYHWNIHSDNKLLVITGGEPARQDLCALLKHLRPLGYKVQIETAGSFWQDCFYSEEVELVCSPKVSKVHPMIRKECNHWKYIIRHDEIDKEDGLPNAHTQRKTPHGTELVGGFPARPPRRKECVTYVQPCDDHNEERNKLNNEAAAMSAMENGYRLTIQMHKVVGLP